MTDRYIQLLSPRIIFDLTHRSPREEWRHLRWIERFTRRYGKPPREAKGLVGKLWGIHVEDNE